MSELISESSELVSKRVSECRIERVSEIVSVERDSE